ncbi:MAG: hypothetical protein J5933_05825 [Clostridia bacterium]|nr:hypothetical protein [Clostridia bacterium]
MDVKYLKRVLIAVLTAAVSVGIVAYLIYHATLSYRQRITTVPASYITEQESLSAEGYIFRDEIVFTSERNVAVGELFDDGDKVPVGSTMFDIYSSENDLEISYRIEQIDQRIGLLTESSSVGKNSDVAQIANNVFQSVSEARNMIAENNVSQAISGRDQLLVQINRLQLLTGASRGFEDRIRTLEREKNALKSSLGDVVSSVTAPQSGYYFSDVDGGEQLFTLEALDEITPESFDSIVSRYKNASVGPDCICKLATDYKWYLVVKTNQTESEKFTVGSYYPVLFEDSSGITMSIRLTQIIDAKMTDSSLLVFFCSESPKEFDFVRNQKIRILTKEYSGYRVPRNALRMLDDGEIGVYVLSGSVVNFRKLNVCFETDAFLISADPEPDSEGSYLKQNENIITQGKGLYDGRIIGE